MTPLLLDNVKGYSECMRILAFILLAVSLASSSAEEGSASGVPDPYGLGERLALIDYLRDHSVQPPEQADLKELRNLYSSICHPPLSDKQLAVMVDYQLLRRYLAKDLREKFQISRADELSCNELISIHRERMRRFREKQDTTIRSLGGIDPAPAPVAPFSKRPSPLKPISEATDVEQLRAYLDADLAEKTDNLTAVELINLHASYTRKIRENQEALIQSLANDRTPEEQASIDASYKIRQNELQEEAATDLVNRNRAAQPNSPALAWANLEEIVALPPGGRQDMPTISGIHRLPVNSTAITSVGWDQATGTMEIQFIQGAVYQYYLVPMETFAALMNAESIGGYFNANIRPNFAYKLIARVEPPRAQKPLTIRDIFLSAKRDNAFERLTIIAKDGTFLGNLDPTGVSPKSIFNEFGANGSEFRLESIWNKFGPYGNEFRQESVLNEFTRTPPVIYYNGEAVCFLSANSSLKPSMTVQEVVTLMKEVLATP